MQLSLVLGQQDTQVHLNPKPSVLTVQQDIQGPLQLSFVLKQQDIRFIVIQPNFIREHQAIQSFLQLSLVVEQQNSQGIL
jgi:hypothetical protein